MCTKRAMSTSVTVGIAVLKSVASARSRSTAGRCCRAGSRRVDEMTCEPLTNFPVIRDLVVDTAPYEQVIMKLKPLMTRHTPPVFPEKIGHAEMDLTNRLSKCIECNVCTAVIPVKTISTEGIDWDGYAGTAALVRFARFALDPRDETDRKTLAETGGLGELPLLPVLNDICPQGIDIVNDALIPARQKLLGCGR